jgi:hypothetical protein
MVIYLMKYEPLYPERFVRRVYPACPACPGPAGEFRGERSPRRFTQSAFGEGASRHSSLATRHCPSIPFASYSFRTLASHLKAAVSSNPFAINRFRTLCKIPGIGYPLPFFFSALSLSDLFNLPHLPSVLRAPDLRFFFPRLPRASAKGARVRGAHRCPNHPSPTPFRINTYKSVTKQTTLTFFRINTYEKHRGRGVVWFLQPEVLHIPAHYPLSVSAPARSFVFGVEG